MQGPVTAGLVDCGDGTKPCAGEHRRNAYSYRQAVGQLQIAHDIRKSQMYFQLYCFTDSCLLCVDIVE